MTAIRHGDAAEHGLTRDQLRHARWAHPVNGVALPQVEFDDLRARCRAVGLVLSEGAVFTHLTAARLRGWWLPRIDPFPVIACTDGAAPHHNRRGVYVRRCEIPQHHRTEVHGIPTSSPEWTIVEAAEHLRLLDLVVLIDGALHQGATTLERLREAMVPGRRGVRVLRQALGLADPRSESPWETVLRLVHVLSNIPVRTQVPVRDDHGELLAPHGPSGDRHVAFSRVRRTASRDAARVSTGLAARTDPQAVRRGPRRLLEPRHPRRVGPDCGGCGRGARTNSRIAFDHGYSRRTTPLLLHAVRLRGLAASSRSLRSPGVPAPTPRERRKVRSEWRKVGA